MTPILTVCAAAGSASATPSAAPSATAAIVFTILIVSPPCQPVRRAASRSSRTIARCNQPRQSCVHQTIRLTNGFSTKSGWSSGSADLHHLLAEILALEQADKGARRVLDAFGHGLAIFDLALAHILAEPLQRLGPPVQVVGDDEALQLDAQA